MLSIFRWVIYVMNLSDRNSSYNHILITIIFVDSKIFLQGSDIIFFFHFCKISVDLFTLGFAYNLSNLNIPLGAFLGLSAHVYSGPGNRGCKNISIRMHSI